MLVLMSMQAAVMHSALVKSLLLQAKLTDSEKKLAELAAKLEHLTIEKSALENRNNILEKVLVMRDQEITKYKADDHMHLQVLHCLLLSCKRASVMHCLLSCMNFSP